MRKRLLGLFMVICVILAVIGPDSQVLAASKKKTGKISGEFLTVDEEMIPCTRYSVSGKNYYSLATGPKSGGSNFIFLVVCLT